MINKDTIVSLKLLTGEEVCGKFISEDAHKIEIDKPFRLIQTEQGFGFVPLMVTTDASLPHAIFKTSVVVLTTTFKEIIEQYNFAINKIPEAQAQVSEATKNASKQKPTKKPKLKG
jgi:hypothetical protein